MIEQAEKMQQEEMSNLGQAFMGAFMGICALCGIWYLAGFAGVLVKMIG